MLGSYRAVASVLGVPPGRLSRWRRGVAPSSDDADHLAALATAGEIMERWLGPPRVRDWLLSPNPHADQRPPAALIREGRIADLMAVVEAEKAGAFT